MKEQSFGLEENNFRSCGEMAQITIVLTELFKKQIAKVLEKSPNF